MEEKNDRRDETAPAAGFTCAGLSADTLLSAADERVLADLIYDTDPYIYPAIFGSRENAEALLPLLFHTEDGMFRLENFFVGFFGGCIRALLLWKEGRLSWSPQILRETAEKHGIPLSPYLDMVAQEYVDAYGADDKAGLISLINLCVAEDCRGRGLGRALMERFIKQHPDADMELCALEDNRNAVRLYESLGFAITERYNGFSADHRRLGAVRMQRRAAR